MSRYIDADALIAEYDRVHVGAPGGARKLMVDAPAADVAPRAEVAREIFEELEKNMVTFGDVALSSYFRGIGWKRFKELKKKYTGESQ